MFERKDSSEFSLFDDIQCLMSSASWEKELAVKSLGKNEEIIYTFVWLFLMFVILNKMLSNT